MKMRKLDFLIALDDSVRNIEEKNAGDNLEINRKVNDKHNAGTWNGWQIHKVNKDGITYYWASCCTTANSNIAAIRRVCGRIN